MNQSLSQVAQKLNLAARQNWPAARALPPLLLVSDTKRLPDPQKALARLPPGSGFIFRNYDDPYKKERGQDLRAQAREHGLLFLVAGDLDLAFALEADGCHMPEHALANLSDGDLLRMRNEPRFIFNTGAAHSAAALQRAAAASLHGALLSPVFATPSHPGQESLGVEKATRLAAAAPLPVFALGGITSKTAEALAGSSFAGLAAITALA